MLSHTVNTHSMGPAPPPSVVRLSHCLRLTAAQKLQSSLTGVLTAWLTSRPLVGTWLFTYSSCLKQISVSLSFTILSPAGPESHTPPAPQGIPAKSSLFTVAFWNCCSSIYPPVPQCQPTYVSVPGPGPLSRGMSFFICSWEFFLPTWKLSIL